MDDERCKRKGCTGTIEDGYCDVCVIAELKAEMVAAQKFNEISGNNIAIVYGVFSSGKLWIFLKLEQKTVNIDLEKYAITQ